MKTFTIKCVTLETLCEFNKLDLDTVWEEVRDSPISFGNNADTLLTKSQLEYILGRKLDWEESEDTLISLGC